MKATDLMIGDWVKYTLTGIPARVTGIIKTPKECNIYAYVGTCSRLQGINERDFEPIPITEEFLKKNGFCSKHNDLYYLDSGWYLDIEGSATGEFNDAYESPNFIKKFTVKYVHELQHLLRMMGEEKEVIL